jgi:hypothetical protein
MFSLEKQRVKISSFNPRAEKHGEDNKLAADIKFEVSLPNVILDEFSKDLRKALYRKAGKGEQQDLIEGTEGLVALKFPRLGAQRWDEEFNGYEIQIDSDLGLQEPLVLVDVTVRKFAFEPIEGGSVAVTFSAICHPEPDEAGTLCALIQEEVDLTLTPPSADRAANDEGAQQELATAA